jgi:membrane associated rhomboid family serine protease
MYITYVIVGFTVLISAMAFNDGGLLHKMKHWPYYEHRRGEYYRLLTAGFVHADWGHLIFNMITLYFFGILVEIWFSERFGALGNLLFVLFYVFGIVAASSATFFRHRDHMGFASIGASGAVSAVLYAAILLEPRMGIGFMFIPVPIPAFIYGILYLWYSSYAARQGHDNIDHAAHFYGAIFGFLFPIVFMPGLLIDFFQKLAGWFQSF